MQVPALIEAAAVATGSQTALASQIGVSPNRISDWKQGVRPCPIETQVELCELAGLSESEAQRHIWATAKALLRAKQRSRNS
jgi:DNA-binding transcriptional regulator YdaS (Cro superfamily)